MSDDKRADWLAEIKARHEHDESWRADGYDPVVGRLPQSHDHRGFLLTEVERLREVLRDTAEDLVSDDPTPPKLLASIIRTALKGSP